MNITREADYAVRIVDCLADSKTRMDAGKISEKTGVSQRFSLKILRKLVGEGIIRSYRGVAGGYELAKDPDQITLLEVIEAIEGPFLINKCLGDDYVCNNASCKVHSVYNEITMIVREKLNAVTFEHK